MIIDEWGRGGGQIPTTGWNESKRSHVVACKQGRQATGHREDVHLFALMVNVPSEAHVGRDRLQRCFQHCHCCGAQVSTGEGHKK